MTTKPKSHKAPAAETDPIFALIAAHKAAEMEWCRVDEKTAGIGEEYEAAKRAWHMAGKRLARTKPTSAAGIGALISYVRRDIESNLGGVIDWNMLALKTCAAALKQTEAA